MLRESITDEIKKRFSDYPFVFRDSANPFAILENKNQEVGALEIYDDGDEVTIGIRGITHTHINPDNSAMTAADRKDWICTETISFIDALLGERVLLYRSPGQRMGGVTISRDRVTPSDCEKDAENFTWAGPI